MKRKNFIILLALFFFAITAFHFVINFNRRNQPPSNEWAKEVLISKGQVLSNPSFIKFKDYYVVVHSDGDKIKILSVDKLGKELQEKQFTANTAQPLSTNVVTDGKDLYVYWLISESGKKTIYNLRLDDKLNILEQTQIKDVNEVTSIGESLLVINYSNNKIGVRDFSTGKNFSVAAEDASLLTGARNREGYIIAFKQKNGEYRYFTLKNSVVSELKTAGTIEENSSIAYVGSTLSADDNFGHLLLEYRFKGEFGGTKQIKFSLKEDGKYEVDEFKVNKSRTIIMNLSPYYQEETAKFFAQKTRMFTPKHYYDDIVEYDFNNPEKFTLVSRSKELSMYAAGVDDTAIFCDVVAKDMYNVYMTSKNEEFKKVNNNTRMSDFKLALWDTLGGILFSFVYIVPYGALWVIPAIGLIAVFSIFEYNISSRKKKIGFVSIYAAYFVLKSMGIHYVSYGRFGSLIPKFMSFELNLVFSLTISLLCGYYAYKKYSDGIENNVGAIHITMPMVYDTILSLMVIVPFMV